MSLLTLEDRTHQLRLVLMVLWMLDGQDSSVEVCTDGPVDA